LPQISQQFIEKYIEEYNKGNTIKDILVECENIEMTSISNYKGNYDFKCPNCQNSIDDLMFSKQPTLYLKCNELKINSKDNTITAKEAKEWNYEEIRNLFSKLQYDMAQQVIKNQEKRIIPLEWLEENL